MPGEGTTYLMGHVKFDPASGDVAVRTLFPEDQGQNLANMAWLVATHSSGARHATTAEVDGWDDMHVPTPAGDPQP